MNFVWSERACGDLHNRTMVYSDADTGLVVAEVFEVDGSNTIKLYPPLTGVLVFAEEPQPPFLGERYSSIGHAMNAIEKYADWWEERR